VQGSHQIEADIAKHQEIHSSLGIGAGASNTFNSRGLLYNKLNDGKENAAKFSELRQCYIKLKG
jgi:hypothetical protein